MTMYFDIRCGDDLDRFARDARPLEVLAQDIYHWTKTKRGSLRRAPNWGGGLESSLSGPLSPTLAADIEVGIRRDFADRVADAKCTVTKVAGELDSYRVDIKVQVDSDFLTLALLSTPSGIVRVS